MRLNGGKTLIVPRTIQVINKEHLLGYKVNPIREINHDATDRGGIDQGWNIEGIGHSAAWLIQRGESDAHLKCPLGRW